MFRFSKISKNLFEEICWIFLNVMHHVINMWSIFVPYFALQNMVLFINDKHWSAVVDSVVKQRAC